MPVETKIVWGEPNKYGNYTIITRAGEYVRVNEAHADDEGAIPGHIPHWARCPSAQEVKREVKRDTTTAAAAVITPKPPKPPKTKQLSMFGG